MTAGAPTTDTARGPLEAIVEVDDRSGATFAIPQAPWRFAGARAGVAGPPAWRGEHNREVLTGMLGRTDADVDALEAAGVLVARPPRHPRP